MVIGLSDLLTKMCALAVKMAPDLKKMNWMLILLRI